MNEHQIDNAKIKQSIANALLYLNSLKISKNIKDHCYMLLTS